MIDLKDSCQFLNQWEAKPKPIPPCTRHFSRALSELQVISRIVIGSSLCLLLLWLVGVLALVLVFRHSFENRSIVFVTIVVIVIFSGLLQFCFPPFCSPRRRNCWQYFRRLRKCHSKELCDVMSFLALLDYMNFFHSVLCLRIMLWPAWHSLLKMRFTVVYWVTIYHEPVTWSVV